MKEVIAVVRMNKMNQTKKALTDAGVAAFFAHEAWGRGKGLVNMAVAAGAAQGYQEAAEVLGNKGKLFAKRMITVVVPDEEVDTVVKTIMEANQTGNAGDGKIFVLPMSDSVRVRTGESGSCAIV
ncbi:MAG: P-II family nitrogen regulator [Desulfovibrio sp.]|nr:P-II family nitrogen regulator [Desulfovibrio sp.]MBI4961563.1 P-II family nitrogen regulator [Desulfovibrio sp.]